MPTSDRTESSSDGPVRIGISSCLLGEKVRFDGGHKRDGFLTETLGPHVEWVPVCPEIEIGLGSPRESLRLVGDSDDVSLVAPKSGTDLTSDMRRFARSWAKQVDRQDLCGFIFKKDSPSCGLHRVRVYGTKGMPRRDGRGIFAHEVTDAHPLLPVEEEGRLSDPALRASWSASSPTGD